jgi:hypothetical protein
MTLRSPVASSAVAGAADANPDRRILLWVCAAALVLIVAVSVLAPARSADDPTPAVDNSGPAGARAAFLALGDLGYHPVRYTGSLEDLSARDAPHTTLLLADPTYNPAERKALAASLERFLRNGGRVLATDDSGAVLLPQGGAQPPSFFQKDLCYTRPEGPGALADTGEVEIADRGRWSGDPSALEDQRCGDDAVVVHYTVGSGEAIWWSSSTPLSNAGVKTDADLRLLLASLGPNRRILFDEALHDATPSFWTAAKGMPLRWLSFQAALLFLLLVLSFGRRRGPIRDPIHLPRTSPTEFARSMGALYARAGATAAATDAARSHLLTVLRHEAGLSHSTLASGPATIAESLATRLPGNWLSLATHLTHANEATLHPLDPKSAYALVRALRDDETQIRLALQLTTP